MKTNKARIEAATEIKEVLERTAPNNRKQIRAKMLLAARIDDLLQAKGWSKSSFAEKLGKRPSEITRWLSGTHNFTIETLSDIAHTLEIDLVYLFAETGKVVDRTEKFVSSRRNKRAVEKP